MIGPETKSKESLAIRILSLAGGILGTCFFLGFMGVMFLDHPYAMIIMGVVTIGGSLTIERIAKSVILDTIAISSCLIGNIILGMGLNSIIKNDNLLTVGLMISAGLILNFSKSFVLNLFGVVSINVCLFTFISINNIHYIIPLFLGYLGTAFIYLSFNSHLNWRLGSLLSLLILLTYLGFDLKEDIGTRYISSAVIVGLIIFILQKIIHHLQIEGSDNRVMIYLISSVILVLSFFSPSISGALFILLLSFHTSYRTGLITGVIVLVYFVGQYYYNLEYSLLIKSGIMFGTGILLTMYWFFLKNKLKHYE
ncbi:MAG: DUF4401 domain-containing protein [Pedobacter sp.]|nr:DUF4401 domain-containing protein [Pedobacter sp.]